MTYCHECNWDKSIHFSYVSVAVATAVRHTDIATEDKRSGGGVKGFDDKSRR